MLPVQYLGIRSASYVYRACCYLPKEQNSICNYFLGMPGLPEQSVYTFNVVPTTIAYNICSRQRKDHAERSVIRPVARSDCHSSKEYKQYLTP